jgi:hypothetical protein
MSFNGAIILSNKSYILTPSNTTSLINPSTSIEIFNEMMDFIQKNPRIDSIVFTYKKDLSPEWRPASLEHTIIGKHLKMVDDSLKKILTDLVSIYIADSFLNQINGKIGKVDLIPPDTTYYTGVYLEPEVEKTTTNDSIYICKTNVKIQKHRTKLDGSSCSFSISELGFINILEKSYYPYQYTKLKNHPFNVYRSIITAFHICKFLVSKDCVKTPYVPSIVSIPRTGITIMDIKTKLTIYSDTIFIEVNGSEFKHKITIRGGFGKVYALIEHISKLSVEPTIVNVNQKTIFCEGGVKINYSEKTIKSSSRHKMNLSDAVLFSNVFINSIKGSKSGLALTGMLTSLEKINEEKRSRGDKEKFIRDTFGALSLISEIAIPEYGLISLGITMSVEALELGYHKRDEVKSMIIKSLNSMSGGNPVARENLIKLMEKI